MRDLEGGICLMDIKLTCQLEKDDFIKFSLYNARKKFLYLPVLAALIIVCMFVLVYLLSEKTYEMRILGALAVFGGIGVDLLLYLLICRRAQKYIESNALLLKSGELIINSGGFQSNNETGSGKIAFNTIYRVVETRNEFYIYLTTISALILLKKHFSSPEEILCFKQLLTQCMLNEKLKLMK